MEIDTFLDGQAPESEPASDIEPATPEAPEPEVTAAEPTSPPRDEHGRFAPKGEQPPAAPVAAEQPTAPPAVEKDNAPPPGLLEERRKRQDLEAQVAQLLKLVGQQPQQSAPQPPASAPLIPSIYEDENGFAHGMLSLAEQRAREALMPEFQQMLAAERVGFQERLAAAKYPDYETYSQQFIQLAQSNPALVMEMKRQADPAEFAYRYAKNAEEAQRLGSLDIDAIKAAAIAEFKATLAPAAPAAPTPPIPTSLADAQSARQSAGTYAPPSLNDILAR